MELRYRLAVVTDAGTGVGRDVAVALGRAGSAVLAVDPDPVAAAETAALVRESRVVAWSMRADVRDELDVRLVAGRARDLGGADVVVTDSAALAEQIETATVVAQGVDADRIVAGLRRL